MATVPLEAFSPTTSETHLVESNEAVGPYVVAADARLDNAETLAASLGVAAAGPRSLVASAYERWGTAAAEHLEGDFAFVLWDTRRQAAFAARERFGAKPLFHARTPLGLAFASEEEQLMELLGRPEIEPSAVVDYLRERSARDDLTFFRGIRRLRPGHTLVATESATRIEPYWRPPAVRPDASDHVGEFRRRLEDSVAARLRSDRGVLCHVSGGLDSSSVFLVADELHRGGLQASPWLAGVAHVFPGLACDESTYVAAVARRSSSAVHRWDATRVVVHDLAAPARSAPGGRNIYAGGMWGDRALAREMGANVILTGTGGDLIVNPSWLWKALVDERRWLLLAREALTPAVSLRARRELSRQLFRQLVPEAAKRLYRRAWPRRNTVPDWVAPDVRRLWLAPEDPAPPLGVSALQRGIWAALSFSRTQVMVEWIERSGRWDGVEYRFPLLSAGLANLVLGIPPQARARGRGARALQRDAMRDLLPPEVTNRRGKAEFRPAWVAHTQGALPFIRDLIESRTWHAGAFVDQAMARTLAKRLAAATEPDAHAEDWVFLWRIATVEAWLRANNG